MKTILSLIAIAVLLSVAVPVSAGSQPWCELRSSVIYGGWGQIIFHCTTQAVVSETCQDMPYQVTSEIDKDGNHVLSFYFLCNTHSVYLPVISQPTSGE